MRGKKARLIRKLLFGIGPRMMQLDNGMVVSYYHSVYRAAKRLLKGKDSNFIKKALRRNNG